MTLSSHLNRLRRLSGAVLLYPLFFLLLLNPAGALAAPPTAGRPDLSASRDYLYPTPEMRRLSRVQALPGAVSAWGEPVTYTDFGGKPHTLSRFPGLSVDILLPDSWLAALTPDEVRRMVDRSDLVYRMMAELVGGEPPGSGPLVAAVVPREDTCGWGCGFIGSKGVEIADAPDLNPILWQDVAEDKGVTVLVHEMTHNFDLYSQYLEYGTVDAHGWTDFTNLYYFIYSQEGRAGETPAETARSWLATTAPYFADPAATWETCVRSDGCRDRKITPNNAWGGMTFRTALLAGPVAARAFLAHVRAYAAAHLSPETPEAKEEIHLEALADGAGQDLSCLADLWHWPVSAALRSRLAQRYPQPNPFCADADGDAVSPAGGDCDDHDPAVHPGATEVANGRDDDCNGIVDDLAVREPAGGDFPSPLALTLPAAIAGRLADRNDADPFTVRLPSSRRLRLDFCAQGQFAGWIFFYDGGGHLIGFQYVADRNCTPGVYNLAAGTYRIDVVLNSASEPGPYTLAAHLADPAVPVWAATAPPVGSGGAYRLTADSPSLPANAADQVRFWVLGVGTVGTVPYAVDASLDFLPPAGFEAGPRFYRAQPLKAGVPVADFTPLQSFPSQLPCLPGPTVLCLNNGRFQVEATWRTATGSGTGRAVALTRDTGMFWFFTADNVELVVKVLDACAFNRRYWLFAAGLTDVEVTLTVTDSRSGRANTYRNPRGTAFAPIQDTDAIAVCDGG